MILSSAETGRSLYQIGVAVPDTAQVQTIIAAFSAPTLIMRGRARFPWASRTMAGRSVHFVLYATDNQAQEILAEVGAQDFGEVRLFKSTDEHGQPIDGSDVIEQFHIERSLPGN